MTKPGRYFCTCQQKSEDALGDLNPLTSLLGTPVASMVPPADAVSVPQDSVEITLMH